MTACADVPKHHPLVLVAYSVTQQQVEETDSQLPGALAGSTAFFVPHGAALLPILPAHVKKPAKQLGY